MPYSSKTQQELEKAREECSKLRKKLKDTQLKLSKFSLGGNTEEVKVDGEDADGD